MISENILHWEENKTETASVIHFFFFFDDQVKIDGIVYLLCCQSQDESYTICVYTVVMEKEDQILQQETFPRVLCFICSI